MLSCRLFLFRKKDSVCTVKEITSKRITFKNVTFECKMELIITSITELHMVTYTYSDKQVCTHKSGLTSDTTCIGFNVLFIVLLNNKVNKILP